MSDLHMYDIYEKFYSKTENSPAFAKYCKEVYGIDFSQDGFADLGQITALLAALNLSPTSKMLEIGCGNGKFCAYIREHTGAEVHGFDYSPSAISSAKKRLAEQAEHFQTAIIDEQNYPDTSFNAVVSVDTLYFTDDLDRLVGRISRWLTLGGVFAAFYMDNNCGPDETQLAKALRINEMLYETIDFSEQHFHLMRRKHDIIIAMRCELERDGLTEHVQRMLIESFDETVTPESFRDEHCGRRYLYIAHKGEGEQRNQIDIRLRLETPDDYYAVELLTREAFWGFTRPTCDEHYLVHILRDFPVFVPELDFVAEVDGQLVGNVMYSKAKVINKDGDETEVLTFGPLSVLPAYWHKGVGSALMRHSISEAKRLGYRAVIFYGHPDYYPRFGFTGAAAFGITNPNGKNFDALMAMPLYDGALDSVTGAFHENEAFDLENKTEAVEAYNQKFPLKEPAHMLPISLLLERLEPDARKAFTDRDIKTLAWLNRLSGREMLCWDGIDEQAMKTINQTLSEYGYAKKLLPSSPIFQQ